METSGAACTPDDLAEPYGCVAAACPSAASVTGIAGRRNVPHPVITAGTGTEVRIASIRRVGGMIMAVFDSVIEDVAGRFFSVGRQVRCCTKSCS